MAAKTKAENRSPLEAVRERIDQIDAELLQLVDERAALAHQVAEAKKADGGEGQVNIRPAREAQLIRRLLDTPRRAASTPLIVRMWRELIGESLRIQGDFHLGVWGGQDLARTVELARARFGVAPPMRRFRTPEEALAVAREPGGVAVLALEPGDRWWGALLARPDLKVFAALPDLHSQGAVCGFAVAQIEVEPSGYDETYFVTDAIGTPAAVETRFGELGFAVRTLYHVQGLRLMGISGFVQADDPRLRDAPGRLNGVIGAAPMALDLKIFG
jgi:chorismate mutase